MSERTTALSQLYQEMHEWASDEQMQPRLLEAVNPQAGLCVVGEALAPETQRRSGLSYFGPDGRIGNTGSYLDSMLGAVGYTVYPPRDVMLRSGNLVPGAIDRICAYFTELCPLFPGYRRSKGKRKINRPSKKQIASAMAGGFLEREIAIVQPRAILLLGQRAYSGFYNHVLGMPPEMSLTEYITAIDRVDLPEFGGAAVIPSYHPSGANPWFNPLRTGASESRASVSLLQRLAEALESSGSMG